MKADQTCYRLKAATRSFSLCLMLTVNISFIGEKVISDGGWCSVFLSRVSSQVTACWFNFFNLAFIPMFRSFAIFSLRSKGAFQLWSKRFCGYHWKWMPGWGKGRRERGFEGVKKEGKLEMEDTFKGGRLVVQCYSLPASPLHHSQFIYWMPPEDQVLGLALI